jgi:hypothetical protein
MSVSRKTGKIYYTDDELKAALDNNNALNYAVSRGYNLIRIGNEYHLKEHDSMVFKQDGSWFWNSKGLHGRAIDFIQNYEDKTYPEAICILADTIDRPAPVGPVHTVNVSAEEKPEFILPERAENYRNMFAYLIKERCIGHELVKGLAENHKIYQGITYNKLKIIGYDKGGNAMYSVKERFHDDLKDIPTVRSDINTGETGAPFRNAECIAPAAINELLGSGQIRAFQNLVMVGYDDKGTPRYASMRSMNSTGKAVKVDVTGSNKSFPFVIKGKDGFNTVCVFESPIEAMSYNSLCQITDSKRIDCPMISLGGAAATQALDRYLKWHPEIHNIVVGLNNDSKKFGHEINAGLNGTEKIKNEYGHDYSITIHKPYLDDWNDVLKNYRRNIEGKILGQKHSKYKQTEKTDISI